MREDLELSICLVQYWEQHAKHLARARSAEKINAKHWLNFFPGKNVADIRPPHQRKFITHLLDQGYAKSTVESIFKTGAAAINFAWKNDMLLNPLPLVSPKRELAKIKRPAEPKWRHMEPKEIALLFDHAGTDRLIRLLLILVGTGARPAACIELCGHQIDLESGTINLLPEDRDQTLKYRPEVRLPYFIRHIYHNNNLVHQRRVTLHPERPMDSIRKSWLGARKRSGLDKLANPYSIRHSVAKWLRKSGVEAWHTSSQMGHKRRGMEITEVYASSDPDYLHKALEAIEAHFEEIKSHSHVLQAMFAPKG